MLIKINFVLLNFVLLKSVGKRCPGPYLSNEPSHNVVGRTLKMLFLQYGCGHGVVDEKYFCLPVDSS